MAAESSNNNNNNNNKISYNSLFIYYIYLKVESPHIYHQNSSVLLFANNFQAAQINQVKLQSYLGGALRSWRRWIVG